MKFKDLLTEYANMEKLKADIKTVVHKYFIQQQKNLFDDYYLYFYSSLHDGKGYIAIEKKSPGKNWELGWTERMPKNKSEDAIYTHVYNICKKLPIMDINMVGKDNELILYKVDKRNLSNSQMNKIYNEMPDKDGYIKVYMPYGPEGRGFYYEKLF